MAERAAGEVSGSPRQLQLVRLDGLAGAAQQLPAEREAMLMQEIGAALRASSIGGDAAGRLGDEAFGLVASLDRAGGRDPVLTADLAEALRGVGIPDGRLAPRVARINIALGGLNSGDAGRVLRYAMNTFVKSAGDLDLDSPQSRFTAAVNDAASRFAVTRQMLTDKRFTIVYQPVVNLVTRTVHHYEALSRFAEGTDTFETVVFGEDVGLIMDFDLIVCRQVIEAIKRGGTARVAVNLSGRSVQNGAFRTALNRLIGSLECSSSAARLGFAGAFRRSELSRDVADLTETRLPAADVGAATKDGSADIGDAIACWCSTRHSPTCGTTTTRGGR